MSFFGDNKAPIFEANRPSLYWDLDAIYGELKQWYKGYLSAGKIGYDDRSKIFTLRWNDTWDDNIWYAMPVLTLYNQHREAANFRSMILGDNEEADYGFTWKPEVLPKPGKSKAIQTHTPFSVDPIRAITGGTMPVAESLRPGYYEDLNDFYSTLKGRYSNTFAKQGYGYDDRTKLFFLPWGLNWKDPVYYTYTVFLSYNQSRLAALQRELIYAENIDKPLAWGIPYTVGKGQINPKPVPSTETEEERKIREQMEKEKQMQKEKEERERQEREDKRGKEINDRLSNIDTMLDNLKKTSEQSANDNQKQIDELKKKLDDLIARIDKNGPTPQSVTELDNIAREIKGLASVIERKDFVGDKLPAAIEQVAQNLLKMTSGSGADMSPAIEKIATSLDNLPSAIEKIASSISNSQSQPGQSSDYKDIKEAILTHSLAIQEIANAISVSNKALATALTDGTNTLARTELSTGKAFNGLVDATKYVGDKISSHTVKVTNIDATDVFRVTASTSTPSPSPQPMPKPQPQPMPQPQPNPPPMPQPQPQPQPGPNPQPAPVPGPNVQPGPNPQPAPIPGPNVQPGPNPQPAPIPGPNVQPAPAPGPNQPPGPNPIP